MTDQATLQVGQQLWFVPTQDPPRGRVVVVTKIGRKWAQAKGLWNSAARIDIESLVVSANDFVLGQCHRDREKWEAARKAKNAWDDLRSLIYGASPPEGIDGETIRFVARLLTEKTAWGRLLDVITFAADRIGDNGDPNLSVLRRLAESMKRSSDPTKTRTDFS